ncbi:hypothetical protein [Rhodoferax sp.]|uniref:hypothetical protein n=1 Tax=Rhodoferax sp. TaxID=50421 RepID=UPI00374D68FB
MKSVALGLLSSLIILGGGSATASQPAQQIFDQVAAAYGATPPAAIREKGTTTSFLRGNGPLVRLFKAPDKFRSEISYASSNEVRTLVGPLAWQQHKPANTVSRGAIALQAARIALPWNMLALRSATVDLGTATTPEGQTVQIVEFPLEPQLKLVVDIEPETGHILRSRGVMSLGDRAAEFVTHYSDFRREGGRIHAGREDQFAVGQYIGYSIIDSVEYPETMPDSDFAP